MKEKEKLKRRSVKIKDLWLILVLDELASANLNNAIDPKFYDYYFNNGFNWLINNGKIIINDFFDNINKMKSEIKHKKEYFPHASEFINFDNKDIEKERYNILYDFEEKDLFGHVVKRKYNKIKRNCIKEK